MLFKVFFCVGYGAPVTSAMHGSAGTGVAFRISPRRRPRTVHRVITPAPCWGPGGSFRCCWSPSPPTCLRNTSFMGLGLLSFLLVLQFVPPSVDTGFCNFTQRIEKGLMTALFEVRKHHQGTYNLTVQVRPARTTRSGGLDPFRGKWLSSALWQTWRRPILRLGHRTYTAQEWAKCQGGVQRS